MGGPDYTFICQPLFYKYIIYKIIKLKKYNISKLKRIYKNYLFCYKDVQNILMKNLASLIKVMPKNDLSLNNKIIHYHLLNL